MKASRLWEKYGSQLEMKVATSFQTSFLAVMFCDTTSASTSAVVA
jgi:hypothetical protein